MIIGLIGYAGSGKDYTAKVLTEKLGFERRAFADKIRDVLYEMNPKFIVGYDTHTTLQLMVDHSGWDEAKKNPEVRKMMQDLGVAMRRHLHDKVWVNPVLANMQVDTHYVITDVRFPNEAQAIKDLGGQIWRIDRPGVSAVNEHISETAMENYPADLVIVNDSDLAHITTTVVRALKREVIHSDL